MYIRKTTKKDGKPRSLCAGPTNRYGQKAIFNDELFPSGSYSFEKLNPDRWVPIFNHRQNVAQGGGELKPIRHSEDDKITFSAWSPELNTYLDLPTRWGNSFYYYRPFEEKVSIEDCQFEVLPACPGVKGVNYRVDGGGGKTGRPKLGAGLRIYNAPSDPTCPDCHDNRYLKHDEPYGDPKKVDEWFVPWGEVRPRYRWHGDDVPRKAITINFPITGIGKIITALKSSARGYRRKDRPRDGQLPDDLEGINAMRQQIRNATSGPYSNSSGHHPQNYK